jgi:hypothetical protein
MNMASVDEREVSKYILERFAYSLPAVHHTQDLPVDAQSSVEKVVQHRRAQSRVLCRTSSCAKTRSIVLEKLAPQKDGDVVSNKRSHDITEREHELDRKQVGDWLIQRWRTNVALL